MKTDMLFDYYFQAVRELQPDVETFNLEFDPENGALVAIGTEQWKPDVPKPTAQDVRDMAMELDAQEKAKLPPLGRKAFVQMLAGMNDKDGEPITLQTLRDAVTAYYGDDKRGALVALAEIDESQHFESDHPMLPLVAAMIGIEETTWKTAWREAAGV